MTASYDSRTCEIKNDMFSRCYWNLDNVTVFFENIENLEISISDL